MSSKSCHAVVDGAIGWIVFENPGRHNAMSVSMWESLPRQMDILETDPANGRRHPLLAGLDDAPRIINGVRRVEVTATPPFPSPPLTLIPSYPDLPMEKVYPRVLKTDIAQVFLREIAIDASQPASEESHSSFGARHSAGRVVYFPGDIDRTFWEVLSVDHFKLLRNAVTWATNEEPALTVTGPGILDVTAWQQKDSLTVHLVNLTNPMMMKGPLRELFPVGEQKVRVRLPEGTRARKVRLLAADRIVRAETSGRYLSVTVPAIHDHEVIAIDL